MGNTLLTPQIIANEALMVLESNLTMAGLVHRDYSKEFAQVGDNITVRKPATFVAKNFIDATSAQDITESSVDVKLDRLRDVTVNVTAQEMTLDIKDFSAQIVEPALRAIAQAVDVDLLTVGIASANKTASVSGTPTISDIAGVGKQLDLVKAPRDNRRLVLHPTTLYKYNVLDNLAKLSYSGDSRALRESEIGKVYTMDTYLSQNCPDTVATTAGTVATFKAAGAAKATEFTITAGSAATGTFAEGDQVIIGGYLYTVTDDLTLVSGGGTLKVDSAIPYAISTAVAGKIITKPHSLGFHRNGLALVTRQLALPMGAANSAIASANGLAVRVVYDYDSSAKQDSVSFDILYGIKALDGDLLVDFA